MCREAFGVIDTIVSSMHKSSLSSSSLQDSQHYYNEETGKKKIDYTPPKGYYPIALLNTLGKVMESIMGKKISYLAETYHLLPETQMGARKGKSMEIALELLTEQVHTIWG